MKKNLILFVELLKRNFFFDNVNLYLALSTLVFTLIDIIVWKVRLADIANQQIFRITVSPISYLYIVLALNGILAITSFDKDKNISYLFWASSLFISILILVLQFFYIANS